MKHQIKIEEIGHGIIKQDLAGSYGKDEDKTLIMSVNVISGKVHYLVENKKEVVYRNDSIFDAIEFYNSI